jgi:integrase
MLATCNDNLIGRRDRAIILCLLDTGARAREFLSLDVADVDMVSGMVLIRQTRNLVLFLLGRTVERRSGLI